MISMILKSTNTDLAFRRVSLLFSVKEAELKPGVDETRTSLSTKVALGNFRKKERREEPTLSFAEIFLLNEFNMASEILSCMNNEAEKSNPKNATDSIANSFSILSISFI